MSASVSIVVPVFNAEHIIGGTVAELVGWLAHSGPDAELVVVDDGSSDGSAGEVQRAFSASSTLVAKRLFTNRENRGKGHALRRGLALARGARRVFIDADLAYPIANIEPVLAALDSGADLAIASRVQEGSRYVMSPEYFRHIFFRHSIGRLFNAITRFAVLDEIRDTQAGLKALTARAADSMLPRLRLDGFSFDVELLFLAQRARLRVDEVPVHFVYSGGATTLTLGRDGLRMLADLARIRLWAARGNYDVPSSPVERAADSESPSTDVVSSE